MREITDILTTKTTNDLVFAAGVLKKGDAVLIKTTRDNERTNMLTGIIVECTKSKIKLITETGARTFDIIDFIKGSHEIIKTLFQGNIVQKGLAHAEKTIIKKNAFVKGRPYILKGSISCDTWSFTPENNGCYLCTAITDDYLEMKKIEGDKTYKEIRLTTDMLKYSHPVFKIFGFEDCYE